MAFIDKIKRPRVIIAVCAAVVVLLILFSLLTLLLSGLFGNNRLMWIKSIGGWGDDFFYSVVQTSDGGFVAVGSSDSNDGDIPGNRGLEDAIIAKFTENGDLVWIESVGGSDSDYFNVVIQTSGGELVAVGGSVSNDGDIPGNKGSTDAIIAKFNQDGRLVWIRNVGGSDDEYFNAVIQTSGGEFVAVGGSVSNDGDIPGNKGSGDAIIAKFNEDGELVWIKNVGGSSSDIFYSVSLAQDSGFVAAGYSWSYDGDISGNKGIRDAIIAMFAEDGDLLWTKNVGGSDVDEFYSVTLAQDSGFVAVGISSSNDFDILGNKGNSLSIDAIIAKFNKDGELVWIKNVGGRGVDGFNSVALTSDGGLVAVGVSSSNDGDIPGNKGSGDAIIALFNEQ